MSNYFSGKFLSVLHNRNIFSKYIPFFVILFIRGGDFCGKVIINYYIHGVTGV